MVRCSTARRNVGRRAFPVRILFYQKILRSKIERGFTAGRWPIRGYYAEYLCPDAVARFAASYFRTAPTASAQHSLNLSLRTARQSEAAIHHPLPQGNTDEAVIATAAAGWGADQSRARAPRQQCRCRI